MNNERYNQIIDEAYKSYKKKLIWMLESWDAKYNEILKGESDGCRPYSQDKFIKRIKTDSEFSERWGLKIEEKELTTVREREKYDIYFDALIGEYPEHHETLDKRGVPRKIIIVTYNNETIEVFL